MNEDAWLAASRPGPLLAFLHDSGLASARKLRLLLCASCRQLWPLFRDGVTREAVELAERQADGQAARGQLRQARQGVLRLLQDGMGWKEEDGVEYLMDRHEGFGFHDPPEEAGRLTAAMAAAWATAAEARPGQVSRALQLLADTRPSSRKVQDREECMLRQAGLVRDIFGNPFRPLRPGPASLLHWNDGTIPRMANASYEDRDLPAGVLDPAHLAILADALADAGCEDAGLLGHLREGVHVRGCWAVDLALGKS